MSNAERQRRKRAKAKMAALAARPDVQPVVHPDDPLATFLTTLASRSDDIGLRATELMDQRNEMPDPADAWRAFALRQNIPGALASDDSATRQKALDIVRDVNAAMADDTASVAVIRGGLRAASKLVTGRRQKVRLNAVANFLTRAIIGRPPPDDIIGEDVDEKEDLT